MAGWRGELAAQRRLAVPVVVVNLAMMGMGTVDAIIVGHDSTEALAAVSLGHAYLWCAVSFGLGVLLALDPLVAQARGAQDEAGIARAMQRGMLLALLISVPIGLAVMASRSVFVWLDQPAAIIPDATGYALASAAGVPFLLGFIALRQSLQALGRLRPVVIVALLANGLNALLDWMFIRGGFGFPRWGAVGCGVATALCDAFMAAGLFWLARPVLGRLLWPPRERALALRPLLRMLRLGLPIGLQLAIEVAAFNAITIFMGWFGATQMAGHRAAIVLAAITFMVPLGVATAAAVRVGYAVGAGDADGVRRAARVSLLLTTVIMIVFAAVFLSFPRALSAIFSHDPAVITVAASLVPLAAAFQVFDGLQVVASGVLRGAGETRWPMVLNLVGYWVLGLPLGWWWAIEAGHGPRALWWGLVLGLGFVALTLLARVGLRLGRLVERIDVEDRPAAG